MYKFGKRSLNKLEGVHPDLVKIMMESVKESPCDFTIISGVRTVETQQELYAQGRTKPGKIVTNADGIKGKSNHQVKDDGYGYAVDLYPYFDGQVQIHHKDTVKLLHDIWGHIEKVAKQLLEDGEVSHKIEWGGNWKTLKDYPHFEIKKVS